MAGFRRGSVTGRPTTWARRTAGTQRTGPLPARVQGLYPDVGTAGGPIECMPQGCVGSMRSFRFSFARARNDRSLRGSRSGCAAPARPTLRRRGSLGCGGPDLPGHSGRGVAGAALPGTPRPMAGDRRDHDARARPRGHRSGDVGRHTRGRCLAVVVCGGGVRRVSGRHPCHAQVLRPGRGGPGRGQRSRRCHRRAPRGRRCPARTGPLAAARRRARAACGGRGGGPRCTARRGARQAEAVVAGGGLESGGRAASDGGLAGAGDRGARGARGGRRGPPAHGVGGSRARRGRAQDQLLSARRAARWTPQWPFDSAAA